MPELKLRISDGSKKLEVNTSVPDNLVEGFFTRVFAFFGISVTASHRASEAMEAALEPVAAVDAVATKVSLERPRKLPLAGSSRSLSVTIGERLEEEKPDWYTTGIKLKDGVPHYRTRYYCKKCGHHGNQYVGLKDDSTTCHKCNAAHKLRPAIGTIGPDGIPERDHFGNFFKADQLVKG